MTITFFDSFSGGCLNGVKERKFYVLTLTYSYRQFLSTMSPSAARMEKRTFANSLLMAEEGRPCVSREYVKKYERLR